MSNKTKKEIEKELAETKQELLHKNQEQAAMLATSGLGSPTMVPIRNYGGTLVIISYEVNGASRACTLESSGPRSSGAIPLDKWLELEENDMVQLGYVARTDMPITNPNVIENLEAFFDDSSEKQITEKISGIQNPNVLFRALGHLESKPKEERAGKDYGSMKAITDRIKDLTGASVSTDDDAS